MSKTRAMQIRRAQSMLAREYSKHLMEKLRIERKANTITVAIPSIGNMVVIIDRYIGK